MRSCILGVLALLASGLPAAAGAQSSSKLAIGTIRGNSSLVRRQILLQVCGPYSCVAATRYTSDDRPDPEKLAAGGVSGYLGGAVTGTAGDRRLILTLITPTSTAKKPAKVWRLRLSPDGRLRPEVLERFSIEMDEILQSSALQQPPAPATPPQRLPPPAAKPPPPAAKPPPPSPSLAEEAPPPPAANVIPAKAPAAEEPPRRTPVQERPAAGGAPLRFAVEGGLWITGRKLSYSGASGSTPLTFDVKAVLVPSLRLELYPAAFGNGGSSLSGLGVFADYGHSVGLKVKPPSGSTGNRDGTLTSMDLGLAWRIRPMSGSRFALVPALAYRNLQLITSPRIDMLPDARLSGYELRLDLDAPVSDGVRLVGGAGYTLWTQAKDLIKGGYFGAGSARGLEVEGGLQVHVAGPLHLKAMVEYQSTSYSGLKDPSAGIGTVSGATDAYLGGRVMARGEF